MNPALIGGALICAGLAQVTWLTVRASPGQTLIWEARRLSRLQRTSALVAGLLVFVGIWYSLHAWSPSGPTRVPTPIATGQAAIAFLADGGWYDILVSAGRVLLGFSIAAAASIVIAFGAGVHSITTSAVAPPLGFIRYIPPTAFTALLIIYFGTEESYKIAVIFVGVFFFNYRMTLDIIEDFDVRYVELASLTGAAHQRRNNRWWLFWKTVVPASAPRVWDVMRINLSFAWTFLVVAETVGAEFGLGKEMYLAQRFFRVEQVYACILLFGVVGLLTDAAMAQAKRRLFKWHDDSTTR